MIFTDIVTVVPRAFAQPNEKVAFVKLEFGAFEISNGLDDKRRVFGFTHDVFWLHRQKKILQFYLSLEKVETNLIIKHM